MPTAFQFIGSNCGCTQVESLIRVKGDPYVIVHYTNQKQERIDTSNMTVIQILDQISAVAEEMDVNSMLTKAGVADQKLTSDWGTINDVGIASKTPNV